MKRKIKRVLDKTTIDDRLVTTGRRIADRTTVDEKFVSAAKRMKHEVRKNMSTAILAAFGFMIALVWRDVIKEGVNKLIVYFSLAGDGFVFTVVTALFTTIVCVIGIIYFSRWGEKG